jgi:tRNA-specific 2-thiouridylase
MSVAVRVRSTSPPQPAILSLSADGAWVLLLRDGEYGVAAGQACVFYADAAAGARVLGGGWIERASSRAEQPEWAATTVEVASRLAGHLPQAGGVVVEGG